MFKIIAIPLIAGFFTHAGFGLEIDPAFGKSGVDRLRHLLKTAEKLEGSSTSPMFRELFGEFNGQNLNRFLTDRIRTILTPEKDPGYRPESRSAQAPTLAAYVLNTFSGTQRIGRPDTLYLSPAYLADPDVPLIHLYLALIHESRHADPISAFRHVDCPDSMQFALPPKNNPRGKKGLCDRGLRGSYALHAIAAANIRFRCRNCSEKTKLDAELFWREGMSRIVELENQQALLDDATAGLR